MAVKKCILCIGQSNMAGTNAVADPDITDDYARWFGTIDTSSFPHSKQIPGIYYWQVKMPVIQAQGSGSDAAEVGTTASNIVATGHTVAVGDLIEITSGAQAGEFARCTVANANDFDIAPALPGAPAAADTFENRGREEGSCTAAGTDTTIEDSNPPPDLKVGDHIFIRNNPVTVLYGSSRMVTDISGSTITLDHPFPSGLFLADTARYARYQDGLAGYKLDNYEGRWHPAEYWGDNSVLYTTGYEYPSFQQATPKEAPLSWGNIFGPDLEIAWQLKEQMGEEIYVIKLALGSTYQTVLNDDQPNNNEFGWLHDSSVINDWNVVSGDSSASPIENGYDLYKMLVNVVLPAAKAGMAAGDTLDIIAIFDKQGESDAISEDRANAFYGAKKALRDQLRKAIVSQGLTSLRAERIPFITAKSNPGFWTYANVTNAALEALKKDDFYTGYMDEVMEPLVTGHYTPQEAIDAARAYVDEYWEVSKRELSATPGSTRRKTLADIRNAVLIRYERNTSSNDATTARLNQLINDALFEIYNTLGDSAYFLRRVEKVDLSNGNYPSSIELPMVVNRIIRIERDGLPGKAIPFKGIYHTDEGRTVITGCGVSSGTMRVHFYSVPARLEVDADVVVLPDEYCELLVVLVCKRLADTTGNATMSGYYMSESGRLWKYVHRDVHRYDRMRNETFDAQAQADFWKTGDWPYGYGGY